MKYFCDYCGEHFTADTPENDTACPKCGSWCIFLDTPEEAARSVERLNEYENKVDIELGI